MENTNNTNAKTKYHSHLFWILAVLAPICLKMALGYMVSDIIASVLMRKEGITDIVELNRIFGQSGLGVVSTGIASLTATVVIVRMLNADTAAGFGGEWYGLHKIKPQKAVIYGVSAAVAALVMNYIVNIILTNLLHTYTSSEVILFSGNILLRLVVLGFIVPVCEEYLFRGIVFKRLTSVVNIGLSVIISALLFGAYHLNVVQFVYAGILGLFLGVIYVKEKNLLVPIIAHAVANIVIILFEYV